MFDEKDIENVRTKILKRLDSSEVKYDGDSLSLYDLLEACKNEFEPYTNYFRFNINKYGIKLNRKSRLENAVGKKSLSIFCIIPEVVEGKARVDIHLQNAFGDKVGILRIDNEEVPSFIGVDDSLLPSILNKNNTEYFDNLQKIFSPFLKVLSVFIENYDGIDYSWNNVSTNESAVLDAEDDLLHGRINLNDLNRSYVCLKNRNDMITSTLRSKKYGVVYDYVEFYSKEFMKRLPVRIDDLNAIYKKILNRYLGIKDNKELKLEK